MSQPQGVHHEMITQYIASGIDDRLHRRDMDPAGANSMRARKSSEQKGFS